MTKNNQNTTIEFTTNIVREYSCTPTPENLGEAKCSMEMFLDDDGQGGRIEWIIEYPDGSEDVEHIGVWFEGNELIDYDGVFSLPKEAVKLIRKCGYRVSEDFLD